MTIEEYAKEFWSYISPWLDAALQRGSQYTGAITEFLVEPANRQPLIIGAALAVLSILVVLFAFKLQRSYRTMRRLSAELEEARSKYDSEVRWRLARERYESKSQSRPQTQLAS